MSSTLFPWQTPQWEQCIKHPLPHALLLAGVSGLGKTHFACQLALRFLCQSESSCHQCQACHWMRAKTHPDFFYLKPEPVGQLIKVEPVRSLINSLNQTAVNKGYQVALIKPIEAMSASAINALLKTLEEPSGQVIFIFISDNIFQVPATLRSRCRLIHFPVPPLGEVKKYLIDEKKDVDIDLILSLTGGIPQKARLLCEEPELLKEREQLFKDLMALAQKQTHSLHVTPAYLKFNLPFLLSNLLTIAIDLLFLKNNSGQTENLINLDKVEALNYIHNQTSFRSTIFYQHHLREAIRDYYHYPNLNTQLLLENLFTHFEESLC